MPATINSDKMSVVHASSSGIATSFPDVCKTPSPAGPVPIPYPNIAMSSDTADGSSTVKMDGNPIMLKSSNYKMSTGDEAGAAMGVASNKIKGKAEPANYSMDVKVDGENVYRLGDPMTTNCGGSANTAAPVTVEPPVVTFPGDSKECERTKDTKAEQEKLSTSWGDSGIIGSHQGPIQTVATEEKVAIYFRRTKAVCGPWIAKKHMPKPHSCLSGTTITAAHVRSVQRFLDEWHDDEDQLVGARARPMSAKLPHFPRRAEGLIGVIGTPTDDTAKKIEPERGGGTQTISYERKWMTGDYDLFQVLKSGDECLVVDGDAFAIIQQKINDSLQWDAIQHGPQAQWKPTPDELKPGVELFDMNTLVPDVLGAPDSAIDKAVTFDPNRNPMFVLDEPLTVVAGDGVVTLKKRKDVKDAMVCQGCAPKPKEEKGA